QEPPDGLVVVGHEDPVTHLGALDPIGGPVPGRTRHGTVPARLGGRRRPDQSGWLGSQRQSPRSGLRPPTSTAFIVVMIQDEGATPVPVGVPRGRTDLAAS